MADFLNSIVSGIVGGVLGEIKKKAGIRTTRRKKRATRNAATLKKIEDLLLGKASRSSTAKKQVSRKATNRTRAKVKRRG
jgi:hypothetical protein